MTTISSALLLRLGVLMLAIGLSVAPPASASRRGSSKATAKSGSAKSSGQKTVHVKSYTKKDGTTIAAHDRKPPTPKTEKAAKAPAASTASTQPRDAKGRFIRSALAKRAFETQTGYPKGRPGYVVDHIRPLACGGADVPSNMQWQTIGEARAKDAWERAGCR
jgi:hypothetical protein